MVSAFAAGIAAQANYTLPAGFNPGEVSSTEKGMLAWMPSRTVFRPLSLLLLLLLIQGDTDCDP